MTPLEFKNQFLLEYDAHGTFASPDMTDYMISLWLTKAQNQIVRLQLSPKTNNKQEGFENSETRRRTLGHLLRPLTLTSALLYNPIVNFSEDSKIYDISSVRVLEIKQEHLLVSPDACNGRTHLKVVPITHDELNDAIINPFRKPSKLNAWRLDVGTHTQALGGGNARIIEIVSSVPYSAYVLRYIMRPFPIIVSDLSVIDPTLSIDGEFLPRTCELPEQFHDEIVSLAVTHAIEVTSDPRLQSHIAVNP